MEENQIVSKDTVHQSKKKTSKKKTSKKAASEGDVFESVPKRRPIERVEKGNRMVWHDLFELKLGYAKKNVSFNPDTEIWEHVEHKHFFHTVDSDGKAQKYAVPIGGHTHLVEVQRDEDGNIVGAKCGPAVVIVKGKVYPYKWDNHTHDIEYKVSEKINVRVKDAEFLKAVANELAAEKKEYAAPTGVR